MGQLVNTPQGRQRIGQAFNLCNGTPPTPDDATAVINWVTSGLAGMAMLGRPPPPPPSPFFPFLLFFAYLVHTDYPYATNYGISLPAWPVNATCQRILSYQGDPVAALAYAIGVFYNNTGSWSCYDINK